MLPRRAPLQIKLLHNVRKKMLGVLLVCSSLYLLALYVITSSQGTTVEQDTLTGFIKQEKNVTKAGRTWPRTRSTTPRVSVNRTWMPFDWTSPPYSCSHGKPPSDLDERYEFQTVVAKRTWIFSAFHDSRFGKDIIVGLGLCSFMEAMPLYCVVWFHDLDGPLVLDVVRSVLPEKQRAKACLLQCNLPSTNSTPYAVAFTPLGCRYSFNNILPVHYQPFNRSLWHGLGEQSDFTVCISPLNYVYNNLSRFVEMVELNRFFGADLITVYNFSVGAHVDRLLRYYAETGLVEVIPWPLPRTSGEPPSPAIPVTYYAQILALNDCLYRHLHTTKYVVFTDLDEFIVPRKPEASKWKHMVFPPESKVCSYVFRCAFFRIDWELNLGFYNKLRPSTVQITSLLTTRRETKIWGYGQRSKFIADTRFLQSTVVHLPFKCSQASKKTVEVEPKTGLMHHYRQWENSPDRAGFSVDDPRMLQFAKDILPLINDRLDNMANSGFNTTLLEALPHS